MNLAVFTWVNHKSTPLLIANLLLYRVDGQHEPPKGKHDKEKKYDIDNYPYVFILVVSIAIHNI